MVGGPVSDSVGTCTKGPRLPEGGGDTIYKALTSDGRLLALKEVEITNSVNDKKLVEEVSKEIKILCQNAHPNIVRYRAISVTPDDLGKVIKVNIFLDFVSHDTLQTRYKDFTLSERQVGLYTRQILEGIKYLHGNNIVHRDIRCANIWVSDEGVCKLVNFGKAKELRHRKDEILSNSYAGKPHWMAPEITVPNPYSKEVDIWSLGCTVLEMLTRSRPYEAAGVEVSDFEVLELLKRSQGPSWLPETLTTTAQSFLKKCLQVQPENRATAVDLLQHPFVTETRQDAAESLPSQREKDSLSPVEAFESQREEGSIASSIEHMCCRISQELEKNAGDFTFFIISRDWLEKCQSDDCKVYTKLWSVGFLKTFETDKYACFENVLDEGWCVDVSTLTNQSIDSAAETTQEGNSSVYVLQNQVTGSDLDSNSSNAADNSGGRNENVFTAVKSNDSKVPGTVSCSEHCIPVPLKILHEGPSASCTGSSRARREASTVMALDIRTEAGASSIKVPITVTCCVDGNQLCIKLRCLKGEIHNYQRGAVLRQTRLSISAVVDDDQNIVLTSIDPGNDQSRVCSTGMAHWEYSRGTQGKPNWYAVFAPHVNASLLGGCGLGEVGVSKTQKTPIHICDKKESLDLVLLKVGQAGCSRLGFKKVLVLERNLANTILARQHKDVTCVDSQADSNPIILTGTFDPSGCDGEISVEITCCAELEIDVINFPEDAIDKIIAKEILTVGTRKLKDVSLCDRHVTFQGVIKLNRVNDSGDSGLTSSRVYH